MNWPNEITCHGKEFASSVFKYRRPQWQTREESYGYAYPFRMCSYCGSIHPEDLANWLEKGATLSGSDWKYGWPHKYYVDKIPNPIAGQEKPYGARNWTDKTGHHEEKMYGPAPDFTYAKWYNTHLQDEGYDDEARTRLLTLLTEKSGVTWGFDAAKGVGYSAPYHGYQAAG